MDCGMTTVLSSLPDNAVQIPSICHGQHMTDHPLVSLVVPVYNGERFIGRTLASALAQTYDPLEIIVIDDGSTDSTPNLIEAASTRDKRIRSFRTQNSGVAAARDFGIKQARGKLIAFLDSDDLWHPEKIARQVEVMNKSSPNVGLIYCLAIGIDENDLIFSSFRTPRANRAYQGRVTEQIAVRCFIETPSLVLVKRECLEAVAGYETELQLQGGEDWPMYFALSEVCEFALLPEYLVGYRHAAGSLSMDVNRMAESIDCVIRWLTERWPNLPEDLKKQRVYEKDIYLARRALDNNQFGKAFYYRANAYKTHPARLLHISNFMFALRYIFRLTGLTRANLRLRGWTFERPIYFQEAMESIKRN